MADEQENLAFDELSKLSISNTEDATLKKENFNIVFCGHVGKLCMRQRRGRDSYSAFSAARRRQIHHWWPYSFLNWNG